MQHSLAFWRRVGAAVAGVLVLLAGSAMPVGAQNANPGVLPPRANPYGSTYAEWSAQWWYWALSIPADQSPLDDGSDCADGAVGQSGPVWFLAGGLDASLQAERNCQVPAGKALFFPLINVECSTLEAEPFYGGNEAELRACATKFSFSDVFAEIDGVPVQELERYRVESPLFDFTLPENNVLGLAPGDGQSVANGYYLVLAPLSAGEHVIRFGGTYPDFDFSLDITYHLTVGK